MADYNIGNAITRIEEELIASMMQNFSRHRAEETELGFDWAQWQALQFQGLETYRRRNQKRFPKRFRSINRQLEKAIRDAHRKGGAEQEAAILEAIKAGADLHQSAGTLGGAFFRVNDRKLNALIDATRHDMERAEVAILRRADDQYRRIIFDAQVYANSGGTTYEKAVDMATKDFLSSGLTCVVYKNGAHHTLSDYADMALKTAVKRAYLQGEGQMRQQWGISTVILNKRTDACPKCARFAGRVYIDDVWSGGSAKDGDYPLLSEAIRQGLYHPRCRDSHTTFFEGITPEPEAVTKDELERLGELEDEDEKRQYAERMAEKYGRLSTLSLDDVNRQRYNSLAGKWKDRLNGLSDSTQKTEPAIAGVKRSTPMSHKEADTFHVNPNYGKDKGYSINCQSCCPVFEARRRGYNIIAKPNSDKRGSTAWALSHDTNLAYIDPSTGKHPDHIKDDTVTTPKKCVEWLKSIVKQGERYSFEFNWKGLRSGGHIVNLDLNENGELRLTDNQRGSHEKHEWIGDKEIRGYVSRIKYTRTFMGYQFYSGPELLRLDNMDFDFNIMNEISEAAHE